jgi:peptide/nickel transport system permease protein
MTKYILRRLIQLPPTLLLITIGAFFLLQAVPGGPMSLYTENPEITAADRIRLQEALGLDKPIHLQYWNWLSRMVRGDWGYSLIERRPVLTIVSERVGNTLYLVGLGLLVALIISIIMGTISAYRQHTLLDHLTTFFALVGYSIPIFWSGLIAIVIFTVWLHWFPAGGMYSLGRDPTLLDRLHHTVLPVSVLALYLAGYYTRFVRGSVLEVKNREYIRTARSKGLSEWKIFYRHAVKNAAIPVVTIVTLDLPSLFGGALFTETIFTWPGMGRLFWTAATRRDYPVLMALITITAILVILSNLLADVIYGLLNPQIREGMESEA